jgi:hypothetical protein
VISIDRFERKQSNKVEQTDRNAIGDPLLLNEYIRV